MRSVLRNQLHPELRLQPEFGNQSRIHYARVRSGVHQKSIRAAMQDMDIGYHKGGLGWNRNGKPKKGKDEYCY